VNEGYERSSFPFSFQLPVDIPSSFESNEGQVGYSMTGKLRLPGNEFGLVSSLQFTVNGILDLNKEPGVSEQIEFQTLKHFHVPWPFQDSSVIPLRVVFPRKGFVCGEDATFTLEINYPGNCRRRVIKIKAELVQTVTYYARSARTKVCCVLAKEKTDIKDQQEESSRTSKEIALRIPPCPPSRLATGCNIINVDYKIQVVH